MEKVPITYNQHHLPLFSSPEETLKESLKFRLIVNMHYDNKTKSTKNYLERL